MQSDITKSQIQNLYAIASKIGILENGNKEDNFHSVVYRLTGKKSVSRLNNVEFYKVKDYLINLQGNSSKSKFAEDKKKKPKKYEKRETFCITDAQIRKIWSLMYELEKLSPSKASVGNRLKGIIKRQLKIDISIKEPFIWLTSKDGYNLIEILKKYVASKENKAAKE